MQIAADADRQQRLANFNNASNQLTSGARNFGQNFRMQAIESRNYDVMSRNLTNQPYYGGMYGSGGSGQVRSTKAMSDNYNQRQGRSTKMTNIAAPNVTNIYLSGIRVNNPEMQKTMEQMMKNPAMRRVLNQLPQR